MRKEKLDEFLKNHFDSLPQSKVVEACKYSLFQEDAKRFRPTLSLMLAESFGVSPQRVLPFAAAVEMIHTYSLIHDDLPCMDNDDFRRGKPTNHKVYGEDFALLAGDSLLTESFFLLSKAYASEPLLAQKTIYLLSEAAGLRGMIAGQALDIGQKEFTYDELKKTHELKTGALIRVACEGAASVCGLPAEKVALCREFGEHLGFAFQVKDDLLDAAKNEKSSYIRILGPKVTQDLLKQCSDKANQCLAALSLSSGLLADLVSYNLNREK